MRPTGFGMKVFGRGASMMFSVLRRITGVDLLEDLAEFFQAFSGMVGGFRERARRVNELLADPETSFLVVCGPAGRADLRGRLLPPQAGRGAAAVRRRDRQQGPLRGRARASAERARAPELDRAARRRGARRAGAPPTSPTSGALAARDRRNVEHLAAEMRHRARDRGPLPRPRRPRPRRPDEVNRYLFASGSEERAAIAAAV